MHSEISSFHFLLHPFLRFGCFFMQVSPCVLLTAELCFKKVINPLHHFFSFLFFQREQVWHQEWEVSGLDPSDVKVSSSLIKVQMQYFSVV